MLDSSQNETQRAISELISFLEKTYTAFETRKQRPNEALHTKLGRRAIVLISTLKLRRLIRRAKRMDKRPTSPAELASLLEDVFLERRVLRSPVALVPDHPQLAQTVARVGDSIITNRKDPEQASAGAVMQICACDPAKFIETYDKPELRSVLTDAHRLVLGMDGLEARNLLEAAGPANVPPDTSSIAYVAAMTLPYRNNGYCTRTEGVALAYQNNGFSIDVISKPGFPLNMTGNKAQDKIPTVQNYNGVRYHRILSPLITSRKYTAYARQAVPALMEKIQQLSPGHVIAASDYRNSLPALIAARRLGLTFTYEVRGMWELTWASDNPGYENTRQFAVAQELEAFVCRHADSVLTLTQGMKNSLVARGVEGDKIALMPNAVSSDMLDIPPHDDALSESLGISPETVVIGYAGAFKEYEGLQDMAAATAKLAAQDINVVLLIVGSEKADLFGSTPITDDIEQAFDRAGRRDRLIMTGRVPFEEMPRYYSLMDICPITRRGYEVSELVSPIKPVEALAQAKAVVLSDVEALKFFSQDETTALLFRKGDVDDLADKLARFAQDKDLREAFGQRGRHFVETELQWSHVCKRAADHIGLQPLN